MVIAICLPSGEMATLFWAMIEFGMFAAGIGSAFPP
jgi:hypothetical protein